MKTYWLGTMAFACLLLSGCSEDNHPLTGWVSNQLVQPSRLPAVVVQMVKKESLHFGEKNPQIVSVRTDVDDPTQKPVYYIKVKGHFTSGDVTVDQLAMNVERDGLFGAVVSGDKAFDEPIKGAQ